MPLQELPLKVSSEGKLRVREPHLLGSRRERHRCWSLGTRGETAALRRPRPSRPGQGSVAVLRVGYGKAAQQAVSGTTRAHRGGSMLEPAPGPPWGGHAKWPTSARALQRPTPSLRIGAGQSPSKRLWTVVSLSRSPRSSLFLTCYASAASWHGGPAVTTTRHSPYAGSGWGEQTESSVAR